MMNNQEARTGSFEVKDAVQQRVLHARRMSPAQARSVMDQIMNGGATPAQVGAFLVALRVLEPGVDEIVAFVNTMKEHAFRISPRVTGRLVDTCGTGGDAFKTINISTLAALVAAAAGLPVAKHGNRGVTSPCGSADLLEAFGVNVMAEPGVVEEAIGTTGIGFMFAPVFHPAMKHVVVPRREIGIRTVFNVLGPLTNPAGAKAHVMGVFDTSIMDMMARVLKETGVEHFFIVHAALGADELLPCGKNDVISMIDGDIELLQLAAADFGLEERPVDSFVTPSSVDGMIRESVDMLNGRGPPPLVDAVAMNAAAALHVGGKVGDLPSATVMAREVLESGATIETLERLVIASGGDTGRFERVTRGRAT